MVLRVVAAGRTDVGLLREHNEDSFALLDAHGLFVVADGMGGHRAGEVASRLATTTVTAFFDSTMREDATWPFHYDPALSVEENRLITSIKVANRSIYEEGTRAADHRGMGTTFVGALVRHGAAWVAHVGDSRGYLVRSAGSIEPLTTDHSLLEEYRRTRPDLTDDQLKKFPYKNVITRALGMKPDVAVEMHRHELHDGDVLLLCCDGLTGMLTDQRIAQIVQEHPSLTDACTALVGEANRNGGIDNITVVLIRAVAA